MAIVAIVAADGPGMRVSVVVAIGILGIWSAVYLRRVMAGQVIVPSLIDVSVLIGLMIATPLIVPDDWLATSTSWIRPFVTFAGVGYQYSTPWPIGVGLGGVLCIVGSVATQAAEPGPPGLDDVVTGVWSFLSIMLARLLWTLLVGATRKVDAVFAAAAQARREQAVAAGIRADQRTVTNALHDTAASTLLMVGLGLADDPEKLRGWAKRDLEILEGLKSGTPSVPPADLCGELRRLAESDTIEVVFLGPERLEVEAKVRQALIGAAAEALANVRRHTRTDLALIKVTGSKSLVRVEIRDRGRGFEPAAVPVTRRGVRDSIQGRLREVGGDAQVESSPGKGTVVRLVWPSD
ncbi:sensor histidine kinase [Acrocarpospora pleiomorpha]|uniref:sensor histidine kinase n=1 Tax=Acrocarpospora pleiomorpha TaxID=90975 RepID=UPI00147980A8|nr:ATP-binding protein [Acrocarpospora pleiomorpha]